MFFAILVQLSLFSYLRKHNQAELLTMKIQFRGLHVLVSMRHEVFVMTLMQKSFFSSSFIIHYEGWSTPVGSTHYKMTLNSEVFFFFDNNYFTKFFSDFHRSPKRKNIPSFYHTKGETTKSRMPMYITLCSIVFADLNIP